VSHLLEVVVNACYRPRLYKNSKWVNFKVVKPFPSSNKLNTARFERSSFLFDASVLRFYTASARRRRSGDRKIIPMNVGSTIDRWRSGTNVVGQVVGVVSVFWGPDQYEVSVLCSRFTVGRQTPIVLSWCSPDKNDCRSSLVIFWSLTSRANFSDSLYGAASSLRRRSSSM